MSNETEWVLVPREPTEAMVRAGVGADINCIEAYAAMLAAAPQPPAEAQAQGGGEVWRPMDTAPRDGTLLRLLVDFEDHATEDTADPAPTIGANSFDNTGEDVWQFAGWCWSHDHFTEGKGTPVGWLPMLDTAPPSAPVGVEALKIIDKWMKNYDHMGTGSNTDARESEEEWEEDRVKLISILAQQSAPLAPVGVERLVSNAIAQGKRLQWSAVMDTLERLRGTLALAAQQPAAVDEAMERAAEEIERYEHTFISTVGASAIIRKHMRAAQQGGAK